MPSFREYMDNWRATDASVAAKTGMAARNTLRRLTTRSTCCGNHGQPGC